MSAGLSSSTRRRARESREVRGGGGRGEIFFSADFPEVELATRILGYGEANVKTIDQFTEN